ncbi:MAG: translation initiation factor IF-2, partial [bacterium]|nr:translation initiation factor IF-2 [bacterium]
IDTPGHEAFTTMRSRGARVADIAVLVVAADDGVKPQTIEAIKIIHAAGLPLLVVINKIDKPDANIDKVKRELSDHGLIPEDWGGKTVCVPVSAKEGTGIDDLLEMILLIADIEKDTIVANPDGETVATIIESHIDKNEGPVATILVQNGTLEHNDFLLVGNSLYGKVRVMKNWKGEAIKIAYPSQPVKVIGLKMTLVIGDIVRAVKKLDKHVEREVKRTASASVVITPTRSSSKEMTKSVNVILKTDTLGSLEAIANALLKIEHPEVKIKIISKELGNITTADVLRAEATHAYIAGFHVTATSNALDIASEKKVEIKLYKIIYELIDEIKLRVEALISPDINRIILGIARVLKIFRTESASMIVGSVCLEGSMDIGARVLILRNEHKVTEGKIGTLQSGKVDILHAKSGQEFGMLFEGKPLIQEGDIIKAFKEEKIKKALEE